MTSSNNSMQQPSSSASQPPAEDDFFDSVFPEILNTLDDQINDDSVKQWFRTILTYNVPGGKKNRGRMVVESFKIFSSTRKIASDSEHDANLKLSAVLGWCVEILQAFFLVADDVMDQSYTRRNQPCWFRRRDVGLTAVNDSLYLENAVYQLLRHYFRGQNYYIDLVELFHYISLKTVIGQTLDLQACPPVRVFSVVENGEISDKNSDTGRVKFQSFTREHYSDMVVHKTAYYSFFLPVLLAMLMLKRSRDSDAASDAIKSVAESILLKMGELFQAQDDYLDCYGDPNVTGKVGTDIQDGKLTWLIVAALERAENEKQKTELHANYGVNNEVSVAKVKKLYEELKIEETFATWQAKMQTTLREEIDNSCDSNSHDEPERIGLKKVLHKFLDQIADRKK